MNDTAAESLSPNDWTQGTHSSKVSLGSHSLYFSTTGPPRTNPLAPVVIIEPGLGGSIHEWSAVVSLLSSYVRVYTYERSGYGRSSPSPPNVNPTIENRIKELTTLLDVTGVKPPWVLVGQSYGGNLVREFLLKHGREKVKGLVIVDSGVERMPLPDGWWTLLGEAKYKDVVGLSANHVLSDEEWRLVFEDDANNSGTQALEAEFSDAGVVALNGKIAGRELLGSGRLSVVFGDEGEDMRKVLDWGEEHGNGTEEAREKLRKGLEKLSVIEERGQRAHLSLSSDGRFVRAEGKASTHNLHMVAPELIWGEVRWVIAGLSY